MVEWSQGIAVSAMVQSGIECLLTVEAGGVMSGLVRCVFACIGTLAWHTLTKQLLQHPLHFKPFLKGGI